MPRESSQEHRESHAHGSQNKYKHHNSISEEHIDKCLALREHCSGLSLIMATKGGVEKLEEGEGGAPEQQYSRKGACLVLPSRV